MRKLILVLGAAAALSANPKNHAVLNGEAKVSEHGNLMQVDASDRSILNWESFSIGVGETTRFVLPSSSSAVLNRVTGSQMSELLGLLQSNGQIYLINQNGIVIGKEGRIDTAGFVASVYELQNTDFLNGESLKILGDGFGEIINLGAISTGAGPVVLIAHRIENSGLISAPEGLVSLNSGHEILLDPTGQGVLFIRPDLKGDGIENSGTIEAYKTHLQADATPTSLAIGLGGIIDAKSVQNIGGEIYLVAKEGSIDFRSSGKLIAGHEGQITLHAEKGTVETRGCIDSSSGTVHLLGEKVHLLDSAYVNVSGESQGGTVLVGGDYQGQNRDIPHAQEVFLAKDARIDADATVRGDGGKVILWADESNDFFGYISAQGGKEGGDGGFVEVSSAGGLSFNGLASTLSPNGKVGTLLLDPTDVTISSGTNNDNTPGSTYAWTGPSVVVNDTLLYGQLALSNVIIDTSAAVDQGEDGNITVTTPLILGGPNSLTLQANGVISLNSNITVSGTGNLIASATIGINQSSGTTTNWSSSNSLNWTAGSFLNLNGTINCTSGADINLTTSSGDLTVTGSISTNGAGIITLQASGIAPSGSVVLSGATLSCQTSPTITSSFATRLAGTVTINTPQALTLTSPTGGVTIPSPAILNTTSSSLSFPRGVSGRGAIQTLTVNSSGGDVILAQNVGLAGLTVSAPGTIQIQGATIVTTNGGLSLTGGSVVINDNSSLSMGLLGSTLAIQATNDVLLGNAISISSAGAANILAGTNITASGTSGTIKTTQSNDLNLVADNSFPSPTSGYGSGKITIPNGYTLCTSNCAGTTGKVMLYTSTPTGNTFPSIINTAPYTSPGSFSGNTYNAGTNEFVGYWYITLPPPDPPLFEIIFKSNGLMVAPATQTVAIALTEPVSNPPQIANVTEGNLAPPSKPDPKTKCNAPGIAVSASL